MPQHVLVLINSILIFAGLVVAGGTIYSGLDKIAKVLAEKNTTPED